MKKLLFSITLLSLIGNTFCISEIDAHNEQAIDSKIEMAGLHAQLNEVDTLIQEQNAQLNTIPTSMGALLVQQSKNQINAALKYLQDKKTDLMNHIAHKKEMLDIALQHFNDPIHENVQYSSSPIRGRIGTSIR